MCGIVVDVGCTDVTDVEDGRRMLERLRHRGPDDSGWRRVGDTWMGHTRLSIVDVHGGEQPLGDGEGGWLVGNGEIYNHADLRAELGPERFRTHSDNEVALHAVRRWGPAGVEALRGMFAFVVADEDGTVVAARDPLGIKPLYWLTDGERTIFTSELRAFEPAQRPGVRAFPPGHRWSRSDGLVPFAAVEGSGTPAKPYGTRDEARTAIRTALTTAVERRLMGDVRVGVFLSGGLDSSIVAALAAAATPPGGPPVPSFATGMAGSADVAAARVVADHLGLEHHEYVYDADEVVAALPEVIRALESFEPSLVRSAVPNHFLARLAAEHVKVVLTGEGADELFAGYDYLRDVEDADLADELLAGVRGLHNLNLQRCDRLTMAHGVEGRVPFLDLDVIEVAQRVPIDWKLPGQRGEEKRLLREAFADLLPHDILWRGKEQFGDGSGAGEVLRRRAVEAVRADDAIDPGLPAPRSDEEAAYQKLFTRTHRGFDTGSVLGRFATS